MSFRHPLSTLFLPNPFAAATINVRINVPGEQARFTPDPFLASGFNGRHDVPLEPDTAGHKGFLNSHVINPLPDEWKDRLIHDPKIDTSKANKTRRLKTSEEWPRRHYEPSLPTDPDLLAEQAKRSSYAYEKIYSTTASSRKGTQYTWSGAKGLGDDIYAIKRSENDMFPPNSDDSEPEGPGRMKRQVIYQATDFEIRQFYTTPLDALWVFLLTSLSGFFCYQCAKFACKVTMQRLCFALPINVAAVALVFILDSVCLHRHVDPCFFSTFLPHEIFWSCPPARELEFDIIRDPKIWFWAIWVVSQAWVTIHIWLPKSERLADTDRLFVMPWYSGVIIEQTLAMNRTRDDTSKVKSEEIDLDADNTTSIYDTISKVSMQSFDNTSAARTVVPPVNALPPKKSMDSITRVYACATMWHETREEMLCMLKSIFRLDEDQCARRNAQKYLKVVDPDYYEVEAHIMFDDAFETNEYGEPVVNRFVRQLLDVIDIAAGAVHQITMRIKCPRKCATPYGGRLQWILPGKNKLTVHLKDKNRIRVRKRWSQVMYMYYLLGHRLMECEGDIKRKEVIAENSYILTLDGDVDFQPHSVQLLVDLMRKNRRLGAACGRIHPRGSGPMVWYQKFEYAIGHWFQKATEHMIGCVLCSPGCFSLFRTSALMDGNVLRRYATKAEKARDYIQYDQGEDRWLCTLLLQRGYRVEYSAASDALTFAPQSFTEFFNQRRRWMPSTIANIMDLLSDYKSVVKLNDSISIWYIIYQFAMLVSSVLGPGTIFLIVAGAVNISFSNSTSISFIFVLFPVLFFMIICFTCKSETQLIVAQVISAWFAMLMMAVIVGTALQIKKDGITSPHAIFMLCLVASAFIAAMLHPLEFTCIIPGILYFLAIPCTYMLLAVYSVCNLHIVSWGTREVKSTDAVEEKSKKEPNAGKSLNVLNHGEDPAPGEIDGVYSVGCGSACRVLCCLTPSAIGESTHMTKLIEKLDNVDKRLDRMDRRLVPHRSSINMGETRLDAQPLLEVDEDDLADDNFDLPYHQAQKDCFEDSFRWGVTVTGAVHLSKGNAGVLRQAQREQKPRVEHKGKRGFRFL